MDEERIERAERRGKRDRGPGLRGALSFVLSASAVLALSLGIAWPLWAAATGARRAYDAVFAAALLAVAGLAAFRVRAARVARARSGGPRKEARR
jgi:hypothetical protein